MILFSLSRYIFLTVSVSLGVTVFLLILITCSSVYPQNCFKVTLIFCVLICSLSLSTFLQLAPSDEDRSNLKDHVALLPGDNGTTPHNSDLSEAGLFALYVQVEGDADCYSRKYLTTSTLMIQVLVLIYTVIPLPLYGTLIVGLLYTCLLEILAGLILYNSR